MDLKLFCVSCFFFLLFVAFPDKGPSVIADGRASTELHRAIGTCAIIGLGPGFLLWVCGYERKRESAESAPYFIELSVYLWRWLGRVRHVLLELWENRNA